MAWYPTQQRYQKANVKQCGLSLNRKTDADLIEWLDKQPNRAAYLKRIIREDMERNAQ